MAKKKSSMRDKAKKKAERNMNRGGSNYLQLPEDTERFRPKKGKFNLDFLPYVVTVNTHPEAAKGEEWYQRTIWVHYVNKKAHLCPKTIKKPCPICDHVKELYNSDDKGDNDLAREMKAKERELYNVIDLDDQDKGVQLFEYSYHLFGKALDEEINEGEDDLGGFAELEGGKTLQVTFRKKKLGSNEFFETRKIEFEERDEYEEDILEDVYNLDELLVIESFETLQKALFELDEEEENEEEERPRSKKSSNKREKDEDEEEKEEEEEEEEEEESSKKKGKKSGKKTKKEDKKKSGKSKPKSDSDKGKKKEGKGKKKSKDECPHGHEFGTDADMTDDCAECEVWAECDAVNSDDEE